MREAYPNELYHHGILGQKWGVRRFQNQDGSLTPAGQKRYNKGVILLKKKYEKQARKEGLSKEEAKEKAARDVKDVKVDEALLAYKKHKQKVDAILAGSAAVAIGTAVAVAKVKIGKEEMNTLHAKRDLDRTIKKGSVISTLSTDPYRTKDADMFYAAHTKMDKKQYRALFGEGVYTGADSKVKKMRKFSIDNKLIKDVKRASEKTGAKHFFKLINDDSDFKDFVLNPKRMESYFIKDKYGFKGYREAKKALDRARETGKMNEKDAALIYRMYNYIIPNNTADVITQRNKHFSSLASDGFGALLDTNDSLYGGYKTSSPVIVFDQSAIVPKSVKQLSTKDIRYARAILVGRKMLGI